MFGSRFRRAAAPAPAPAPAPRPRSGMMRRLASRSSGMPANDGGSGGNTEAGGMGGGMKKGGKVSSASKRADGIATKGKTKGRMV